MPEQMMEPFLLVNCPALIFPYLRHLVQDLTREEGFPPLVLDPIDFGSLYVSQQREEGDSRRSSRAQLSSALRPDSAATARRVPAS